MPHANTPYTHSYSAATTQKVRNGHTQAACTTNTTTSQRICTCSSCAECVFCRLGSHNIMPHANTRYTHSYSAATTQRVRNGHTQAACTTYTTTSQHICTCSSC